jgi:hypothetical protein
VWYSMRFEQWMVIVCGIVVHTVCKQGRKSNKVGTNSRGRVLNIIRLFAIKKRKNWLLLV